MSEVSVTVLRKNLSAYLARVERGESFCITVRGRVIADISPLALHTDEAVAARKLLRGSVLHYERPFDPAFDANEWEMNQ